VHLGRDEGEPLHELVALERSRRRRERAGLAIREVLQEHVRLGEPRAVVELEHRHVALRVDRAVIGAVRQRVLDEIDLDRLVLEIELVEHDVWGLRAGTRGVVKLHG
jgi:hypothetical protein